MAELSTKARDRLKKSQFALPGKRAYPIENASHAGNAKARAKQQLNAGNLSQSQYDAIVARANKVLGRSK